MADNLALYGFRWMKEQGGGSTMQPMPAIVASAYQAAPGGTNVDLQLGDPVKKVSDGSVALVAVGDPTYGIVVGVEPFFDSVQEVMRFGKALPGGTTYGTNLARQSIVKIVPIAMQVFEVDVDDAVTATTKAGYQAFIGENADISFNASASLKKAFPRLDISLHATTNTLVWRIVGLSNRIDQDYSGANVKLLVTGNVVQQAPFTPTGV